MNLLKKQRTYNSQRDAYRRKVELENLDGYGWTMSLDSVRTPEEILLVKQRFERLEARIARLPPRVERVMRLRLGINCKIGTLEEIAQQFGVTRERIRQLENKGLRILKRWSFIEEKPEQYLREKANLAKVDAERRRLERETELAEIKADAAERKARQDAPALAAEALVDRRRREHYEAHKRPALQPGILEELVREQHRALALEREYRGWAEGRERTLLPASVLHGLPYAYKMRRVEPKTPKIERNWLHVATEGFKHGT